MLPASKRRSLPAEQRTIGGYTELHIEETYSTARTKNNYNQARTWLLKSIDADKNLGSVTLGELRRWQKSLSSLALSTRNKHIQRVKTMFSAAMADGILLANPTRELREEKSTRRVDRSRQLFVDANSTTRVLESLPTASWKLIFALMRFQGLRRHEVFALCWQNIDWERNELSVPEETKTGWRGMPIFPETLPLLRDAFEAADDGAVSVVQWNRSHESVTTLLRKRVEKVLGSCRPKPCQQLRSTRRTELDEQFPSHVVNEWLGHDSKTAEKHYQQVTPEHLSKAHSMVTASQICTASCTAESHSTGENDAPCETETLEKPSVSCIGAPLEYPVKDSNLCCRTESPES